MRFEASSAGGRRIIASDVPEDFRPMLRGLGFEPGPGGLSWEHSSDGPGWDDLARNWPQHGARYVDQCLGIERPDWRSALNWITGVADAVEADWFVVGSAGLAVRGIDVDPGGVELAMDEAGADRLACRVGEHVMQPIGPAEGWPFSRYGRLFRDAPVQVIGGMLDQSWPSPWDSAGREQLETVVWQNRPLRVTALGRELQHARRMMRHDHARAIMRFKAERGELR